MLRIYLLGDPRAFDGDLPMALPTPAKVLALWSFLLLKRQRPISRDHLAFTLWPDQPEAEARANLRRHLYLLRRQLPNPPGHAGWILANRNTVQWNPEAAYWLDVALVEGFDEASASEAEWAELLDHHRGHLLEGLYEDWVQPEDERLQRRIFQILEHRVAMHKARGDLLGAIYTAQHLLALDPWREESYRELMELHYRAGDRTAALREFERCEEMLRADLAVEPMPETLALRDEIVSGRAFTPLPVPRAPDPPRAVTQPEPSTASLSPAPVARRGHPRRLPVLAGAMFVLIAAAGLIAAAVLLNANRQLEHTSIFGLAAVQDTWLNSQIPGLTYDPDYAQDVYADYPQTHLSYWNYPYDRVLIRFDLDAVPSGAEIERAILYLHLETFTNEDLPEPLPATVSAFRLLVPWEETTATFDAPWMQPGLAPGSDYEVQPLGSDAIHGTSWISIDVTGAARTWVDHTDENWGLVLMITEAPQGAHYWVDMTDYPLSQRQPRLDITYHP